MLSSYAEVLTMNFNRKLVTGLFGLALIAAPITAAAKDNDSGRNNSHQEQAQPSRSNDSHPEARQQEQGRDQHQARVENRQDNRAARVENRQDNRAARVENRQDNRAARVENRQDNHEARVENRQDNRNEARGYNGAPYVNEHRDAREDRRDGNWNGDRHERGDHDGHWIYGDRGRDYDLAYDPDYDREYESGWVMPYSYSGGACAWARHLRNVYRHDQYTGHPAAAESLIWQMRRAERACGGEPYGYNSYRYPY
jgi:hypothetical protein